MQKFEHEDFEQFPTACAALTEPKCMIPQLLTQPESPLQPFTHVSSAAQSGLARHAFICDAQLWNRHFSQGFSASVPVQPLPPHAVAAQSLRSAASEIPSLLFERHACAQLLSFGAHFCAHAASEMHVGSLPQVQYVAEHCFARQSVHASPSPMLHAGPDPVDVALVLAPVLVVAMLPLVVAAPPVPLAAVPVPLVALTATTAPAPPDPPEPLSATTPLLPPHAVKAAPSPRERNAALTSQEEIFMLGGSVAV